MYLKTPSRSFGVHLAYYLDQTPEDLGIIFAQGMGNDQDQRER